MGDGGFWAQRARQRHRQRRLQQGRRRDRDRRQHYSAATGGQDILSSRAANDNRSGAHPIEAAVRGVGVQWVRTVDRTYDVNKMQAV